MKKIDATVLRETVYIAGVTLILSIMLQSAFLIIGKWSLSLLLGNILGFSAAVGNFFLLGLTVQNAVTKEEKEAKELMKLSQIARMFLLFTVALVGYLIPIFNTVTVVLPYLFPRIAIAIRPLISKMR